MKRDKLPALMFYTGDWRKDPGVQALDYFDRGVWFEMLMIMWETCPRGMMTLNGQAMTDRAMANLLGLDNQKFNQTLTTLLTYGVAKRCPVTGIVYNRRMMKDEHLREIRRNNGKKGGNPFLVNQKSNQTPTKNEPKRNSEVNQIPEDENEYEIEIESEIESERAKEKEKEAVSQLITDVIEYLNQESGKNYQVTTPKYRSIIRARYKEKFVFPDFQKVIDIKVAEWKGDRHMNQYLRPETLFGPKFESYLNQQFINVSQKEKTVEDVVKEAIETYGGQQYGT